MRNFLIFITIFGLSVSKFTCNPSVAYAEGFAAKSKACAQNGTRNYAAGPKGLGKSPAEKMAIAKAECEKAEGESCVNVEGVQCEYMVLQGDSFVVDPVKKVAHDTKVNAKADAKARVKTADIDSMNSVPELRMVVKDMRKLLDLE